MADDREDEKAASIHYLLFGLQNERLPTDGHVAVAPGLLRAFLTALLLPMVIWLIQILLAPDPRSARPIRLRRAALLVVALVKRATG